MVEGIELRLKIVKLCRPHQHLSFLIHRWKLFGHLSLIYEITKNLGFFLAVKIMYFLSKILVRVMVIKIVRTNFKWFWLYLLPCVKTQFPRCCCACRQWKSSNLAVRRCAEALYLCLCLCRCHCCCPCLCRCL